mmetsp:Transcript_42944/g.118780  ORF Transcript_42944/g.118780 Transcript_42944/m.118780 type:complete len:231 (-) Transcript_42944:445-1137(-)
MTRKVQMLTKKPSEAESRKRPPCAATIEAASEARARGSWGERAGHAGHAGTQARGEAVRRRRVRRRRVASGGWSRAARRAACARHAVVHAVRHARGVRRARRAVVHGLRHARCVRCARGASETAAAAKSQSAEMGAIQYWPSMTPNLRFCSSFCVRTSRTASATSAVSISARPSILREPAPREATAVPTQMPTTLSETRVLGSSMPLRVSSTSVTTGVNALSIWIKPTGR